MTVAIVLGGLIGIEREWNNHPAGFRTHILVCLGSATLMILSIYGFSEFIDEPNIRIDPARLAAQVVSGIGFLGAGAILRNGSMVTGLTTAASVWVVASIGLCVGAGFYKGAISASVLVLISLHLFNRWEKRWMKNRRYHNVSIKIMEVPEAMPDLMQLFGRNGVVVKSFKAVPEPRQKNATNMQLTQINFQLKIADFTKLFDIFTQAAAFHHVQTIQSSAYEYRKSERAADLGTSARL
ncbi:MgtC/SapB family protein [Cohnella cellulosilytica]|uniref:MgtC/SapB family protein n=1 Tax=Cohnella cellulosilytica TaxID=986710 RepID=A0ABW2F3A1_9BACL